MEIREYLAKPDKTIGKHTDELLQVVELLEQLGYLTDKHLANLLRAACEYHDYGKVNDEFQRRVENDIRLINPKREIYHNILSFYFINRDEFDCKDDFYRVAHAVLHHHNYCDVFDTISQNKVLIEELLANFPHFNLKPSDSKKLATVVNDPDAVKIKGLLHKCDYSASGCYQAEYRNDFLTESLGRLLEKWQHTNASAGWNALQKFCMENQDSNIIAVAQTGMGKTEGGLHWIGNHKGFFVLPVRTAINAIYERIRKEIIQDEKVDTRIAILHSNSLEYYLKVIEEEEFDIFEYQNRGKRFSIPLSISTMDQLFDFVFKYQGYEFKLATFAYSKILIDEIQMYGPDLLAYLIAGIEAIVNMGGKVAIMTATLAPFIQDKLKPLNFKAMTFWDDSLRHNLEIRNKKISSADISELFYRNKNQDRYNKILVVCNTVKKAQSLFKQLSSEYQIPEGEIKIIHSRYINRDRAMLEKEIVECGVTFDDDGQLDKRNIIWIATSLVEASLDIDFDYLFTELQDLNSLFQRLGRCNRKGVKGCVGPNCFVYTKIEESTLRKGTKGFIDETVFDLSREALLSIDGPLSEKRKIELINNYMTTEKLKKSDFSKDFNEIYRQIKQVIPYQYSKIDLRNIRSVDIIPSPIYDNCKEIIETAINTFHMKDASAIAKRKAKVDLMDYVVSIPFYDYEYAKKKISEQVAQKYPSIALGLYEEIKIIECDYDKLGYQRKDYEGYVREPNII